MPIIAIGGALLVAALGYWLGRRGSIPMTRTAPGRDLPGVTPTATSRETAPYGYTTRLIGPATTTAAVSGAEGALNDFAKTLSHIERRRKAPREKRRY